jgi:hypothetical protein
MACPVASLLLHEVGKVTELGAVNGTFGSEPRATDHFLLADIPLPILPRRVYGDFSAHPGFLDVIGEGGVLSFIE